MTFRMICLFTFIVSLSSLAGNDQIESPVTAPGRDPKNNRKPPKSGSTSFSALVARYRLGGEVNKLDIPVGEDAFTWRQLAKRRRAWWRESLRDTYKRFGKRNNKWNQAVETFHDDYALLVGKDYQDKEALFKRLLDEVELLKTLNCEDPYVLCCMGDVLYQAKTPRIAEPFVRRGFEKLEKSGYPNFFRFLAGKQLFTINIALKKNDSFNRYLPGKYRTYLAQALEDEIVRKGPRFYYENFFPIWEPKNSKTREVFYKQVSRLKTPEPWLKAIIDGLYLQSEASMLRRTDPQKKRKELLTKAKESFQKASTLNPERPESFALLIEVVKELPGAGSKEALFNSAVKKQMDYYWAYYNLWMTYQRFGREYKTALSFGQKCLDTKRFDTNVPYFYVNVIVTIIQWSKFHQRFVILRRPGVYEKLMTIFDKIDPMAVGKSRKQLDLERAIFQVWTGHYQEALPVIEASEAADYRELFTKRSEQWIPASKEDLLADIRAYTSSQADALRKAEELCLEDKPDQAIELLKKRLPETKDKSLASFVRDLIARIMLDKSTYYTSWYRTPPLFRAVYGDNLKTVRFLLANRANVNTQDANGATPLHHAVTRKLPRIADCLIANGADPRAENRDGFTPAALAIKEAQRDRKHADRYFAILDCIESHNSSKRQSP